MTDTKKSYKDTLNLPKTKFGMKANLAQNEPMMVKRWKKEGLYQQIQEARKGSPKFTMHDGPPYPNGDIHLGHTLNKTLKDIVTKHRSMKGFSAPFIPGWDCHGLPIEHKVMKELGDKAKTIGASAIRKACAKFASKYVKLQCNQFQSMHVFADWDNPYLTLQPSYEAGVIETFGRMLKDGYVYRGLRTIHWCISCATALAEAEIEYAKKTSPSIYAKFPVDDDYAEDFGFSPKGKIAFLIWTTTPWTLPANMAIALGRDIDYCAVEYDNNGQTEYLIVAEKLADKVFEAAGKTIIAKHGKIKGADLESKEYNHPFIDRVSPIVLADYVSVTDGTGCVHTAPGHGHDDYLTGVKYKLPMLCPVNTTGHFTFEAPEFLEGKIIWDGNPGVIEHLKNDDMLFHHNDIEHDYPHCWRCSQPVIFRASDQWFIAVDHKDLRQKALHAINNEIQWMPAWGSNRIGSMVSERPDWCISRQRYWGVPIPAFYCEDCGHTIATAETTDHVRDLFAAKGANIWFEVEPAALLPDGYACPECKSSNLVKEHDIFDVWFESGSSHRSVVIQRDELQYPADLYLEGSDQHRGWFQLTLLPALAGTGVAPYKHVVTHGFTVDENGHKMSKKLGNYIAAMDAVKQYGADVLRLLFASVNYTNDISLSENVMKRMSDTYRTIRNRFRYLLSNLYDFDASNDTVAYADMQDIDRWILNRLHTLIAEADKSYTEFQFYKLYHQIYNFLEVDLSSFYMDVLKDRLYADAADGQRRRSAQTAMHHVASALIRMLAPILSYTCEEAWQRFQGYAADGPLQSVHLENFPVAPDEWEQPELQEQWSKFLALRDECSKVLEALRSDKTIGTFMEADLILSCSDATWIQWLQDFGAENLSDLLIVSSVTVSDSADDSFTKSEDIPGLAVKAQKTDHGKCQRCWNFRDDVGSHTGHEDLCERCVTVTK